MKLLALITGVALVGFAAWILQRMRRSNVFLWLPAYARGRWAGRREPRPSRRPVHVLFCIADHFEPALGKPAVEVERRRVQQWLQRYPALARDFRDCDGHPPRHTFFFPAEEYRAEHIEALAQLVKDGYGEVEVHLHHDRDTSAGLKEKLLEFAGRLRAHGLLGSSAAGAVRFGFVHGNWALDNSHPQGLWCGVNDELRVLKDCGCYADCTLPSAPSGTQTRRINSIYYAADDPQRPKSHDDGTEVSVGSGESGDLMIVQGPLGLRWPGGRFGLFPRLENGGLTGAAPPTARRIRKWIRTGVCIAGRPEWVFVKVYTHGCNEANWDALLGGPARFLHEFLRREYNDGARFKLHYVTARELYNIVRAAQHGLAGDPGGYRDYEVLPPPIVTRQKKVSYVTGRQLVE